MKKILIGALLLTGCALPVMACTGISATAKDGGYVQARTIEWGDSYLPSQYVVIPCGHEMISYTPKGMNGAKFRARYGVVGLSIVLKDFVVEGLNEAGLSAGLFYFPHYGNYPAYDSKAEYTDSGRFTVGSVDAFSIFDNRGNKGCNAGYTCSVCRYYRSEFHSTLANRRCKRSAGCVGICRWCSLFL